MAPELTVSLSHRLGVHGTDLPAPFDSGVNTASEAEPGTLLLTKA